MATNADAAHRSNPQGHLTGSALVVDGHLVAQGHNKRVQENNPILHGEMDCLNNAGRVGSYRNAVIYSTLMPCYMCAGTIVQFKIPKVVVGESVNFPGARAFMEEHGVQVVDVQTGRQHRHGHFPPTRKRLLFVRSQRSDTAGAAG